MDRQVVRGVTIDAEHTRDIDDALWFEQDQDHRWHVLVSIADVAEDVPVGGKMDLRAREMVTTKYFGLGNSPMLPRHFAEDQLSLWPGKERKTLTIDLMIEASKNVSMNVLKTSIYPSILTSRARCPYDRVPEILKDKSHEGHEILTIACQMALRLMDLRRKAGAFVLFDLNNGWITTEEGFLRKIEKKEEVMGQIIVQEMMVLANSKVAEFAVTNNIPVLFRNHTAMSAMPDRGLLMAQITDALATPIPDLDVIRQRTHMLLGRASYSDSLLGHYGLNLPAYLHFTSPIRRYADLITHRQIKAHLAGQPLPYSKADIAEIATHINDTLELERERASVHFKNRDEQKAHQAIDARRLDGLDAAHFERVTKVEVRSGENPSEAFAEAFLRRLKENRLPLIALTVIMTQNGLQDGWRPLRQAILDHLASRPEDATSLLAQAQGVAEWPVAKFTTSHVGPDHARTFTAEASLPLDAEVIVGLGKGASSKAAKQCAAIDLLARLVGCEVPTKIAKSGQMAPFKEHEVVRMAVAMPDKNLVVGSTVSVVHVYPGGETYEVEAITGNVNDPKGHEILTLPRADLLSLDSSSDACPKFDKDPVSALMEYCAKTKGTPNFTFDKSGPDHMPRILCTCRLGEIARTAEAGNKQDAKKQAARAVLSALPV